MEIINSHLESLSTVSQPPIIEIFIAPEVFQELGYSEFDGSHTKAPAHAIARLPALAHYRLSCHGVTYEKPRGVRMWFIHNDYEEHSHKGTLPKYRISLQWAGSRPQLTAGYLPSSIE